MSADDLLYAPMGSLPTPAPINIIQSADLRLPSSWTAALTAIRQYSGLWADTALAGGCLRDLDLGRPVKDVDIFLPYTAGVDVGENLSRCLATVFPSVYLEEVKHDPQAHSALTNGTIVPSHYMFYADGWLFEITQKIEAFDHKSILDSFDLGICMIALDGSTLYRAPEYQTDAANHTITIVRSTGGREYPHAKRLQQKYTNWTIVQP